MLKTILSGNLGNDAEFKTLEGGKTLVTFDVAHNESYKNAKGEKVENTQWVKCNIWSGTEKQAEFLKKGKNVLCEGKVRANAYTSKDNEVKGSLELDVKEFEFIS